MATVEGDQPRVRPFGTCLLYTSSGRIDALAGKWDFDGTTAYEFDGKGSGAMLLTLADYDLSLIHILISLSEDGLTTLR